MSEKTNNSDISELSFEAALAELEKIVGNLESGEIALEDSIAKYERGEALKARCEVLLKQAESRIEKISRVVDGVPEATEPLDMN